jgi:hypothetical protein
MSVKESSATALVRFTGLGIICFNKESQRGEIGVIRDDKHTLSIRIQQPVFKDGTNDNIVYEDVATYQKLPKDDVQIEIKSVGQPAIEGYEIYQVGDFDRLDSPDINDFRWIVNMSELHGDAALTKSAERPYPLTKISIGNGLYYTHKLDTNLFFERVETGANGKAATREVFGNVGETIGVKLEGDEVSFTIRIGEQEETQTLKRVAGLPFKIEIKNMDYNEDAVYSDMADYYTYVSSSNGTQFDLAPIIEEAHEAAGGAINQKQFCHPVVVEDPPGI